MNKFAFVLGMLWVVAALSGCTTTAETNTVSQEPSSTIVVVNESTQTVTVTQSMTPAPPPPPPPPKPQIDILAGAKKPCSTVAADAPKFVAPDAKQ